MTKHILERAALPTGRGTVAADIVLCHLPHNTITPYVTWQMNLDDQSTYWGHYHSTLEEAAREFNKRCIEKNARRYTDPLKREVFS